MNKLESRCRTEFFVTGAFVHYWHKQKEDLCNTKGQCYTIPGDRVRAHLVEPNQESDNIVKY